MVYSGGFLLKPRSKLANYEHFKKTQAVEPSKILEEEKQNMMQVKSLGKVIRQRQELMNKIQSERYINDGDHSDSKVKKNKSSHHNDNIAKTIRFLKNIQIKTTSVTPFDDFGFNNSRYPTPQHSSKSKRPQTRSDIQDLSPVYVFQNPIQKVLITHKDQ